MTDEREAYLDEEYDVEEGRYINNDESAVDGPSAESEPNSV